jgi:hypothetical protein
MAKRRSKKSRGMNMQPAVRDLAFKTKTGVDAYDRYYIDTMREMSKVNRRLYKQGMMVGYNGLTFIFRQDSLNPVQTLELTVRTAPNSWMMQNGFVKGKALWNEMQQLVLADNPSLSGKWHDFKCTMQISQIGENLLDTVDADGTAFLGGEWNYSTYVMPQHQVSDGTQIDPVTGLPIPVGEPLPADEFTACLFGENNVTRKSLLLAYQDSRATVSLNQPNTPADMPLSFFSLLTDSGSQEPELAEVIMDENEDPPYSLDHYPGTNANGGTATAVAYSAISVAEVDGRTSGFVAPCGLLEIEIAGFDSDGAAIDKADLPSIDILLHVAAGSYKGIAAIPMGQ